MANDDELTEHQKEVIAQARLEQNMARFGDIFPPLWMRMYRNLQSSGFSEAQAFDLLQTYILAANCTSGIRQPE
jgi:hypothetical protein